VNRNPSIHGPSGPTSSITSDGGLPRDIRPSADRGHEAQAVIRGRVVSTGRWPVEHAILTLIGPGGRQIGRTDADAAGNVVVSGIAPGAYTLSVSAPGYQPLARNVIVGGDGLRLSDIVLGDAAGRPLPEPGVWDIDPVHSSARLRALHLGFANVHGRISDLSGEITINNPIADSTVTATLKAASIDTGNVQRDAHLRSADFLDAEAYPDITFRSSGLVHLHDNQWAIDGDLTIRDISRRVRLDTLYLGTGPDPWGGTRSGFHATTELHRDDFAVNWNQAVRLGIGVVGATVQIELDIEIVRRSMVSRMQDRARLH
jgi:polyisoprenoid-binding protein YceI